MATTTAPTATITTRPKLSVQVEKPTPYTFDLGLLLANDANPITIETGHGSAPCEQQLAAVARDGAQALINQMLTTCPIERGSAAKDADSGMVLLCLPPASTPLPREKSVPQPKPPTKWEQFAARKGIKPKTREQRRNLQFDETTGTWGRKWGFRAANKAGEDDWAVEVRPRDAAKDEKHAIEGTSWRGDIRRERKERVKRNERKMHRNKERATRDQGKR